MTIHTISQTLNPDLIIALGLISVNRPEGISTAAKLAWHALSTTISTRDERQPVFVNTNYVV